MLTNEQQRKIYDLRNSGLSYGEISKELNIPKSTVGAFLKNYPEPIMRVYCPCCGMPFIRLLDGNHGMFCSDECERLYLKTVETKTVYKVKPTKK